MKKNDEYFDVDRKYSLFRKALVALIKRVGWKTFTYEIERYQERFEKESGYRMMHEYDLHRKLEEERRNKINA